VGVEAWRYAVGIATWRNGGMEARCRRADVEALEVWRYRGIEVWRRIEGV